MEGIGIRLKQLLEKMELSPLAFSEQVGIQRSSLSHLFSGRNKPSVDLLLKIKNKFPETDLEWLLTGESFNSNPLTQAPIKFDDKKSLVKDPNPSTFSLTKFD